VILRNDRAYGYWQKLVGKDGVVSPTRWTAERRLRFIEEYGKPGLDLRLLVLFHRADNAYRREEVGDAWRDSVAWFENRLLEEELVGRLPSQGRDEVLQWQPSASRRRTP
jgi:hypothetical protein